MKKIIYFSAEYGLADLNLPIYAGGLGILAGDTLKEASSLKLPMVGIGVLYRQGFFTQKLDNSGWQQELYPEWTPKVFGLEPVKDSKGSNLLIEVPFPDRVVFLKIWKLEINSQENKAGIPLYLLDADNSYNSSRDRKLTSRLYSGDWNLQLEQEVLMGIGGVRAVRALGINAHVWHLNDDHAAFSLLWRLRENLKKGQDWGEARVNVKKETVFTTHTPIAGAESTFGKEQITPFLDVWLGGDFDKQKVFDICEVERNGKKFVSLTILALRLSKFRNAVSLRHQQTSKKLWHFLWPKRRVEDVPIDFVTNGVNAGNWICPQMANFFSQYLDPQWEQKVDNPKLWQKIYQIPDEALWQARLEAKKALLDYLSQFRLWEKEISPESLFIGFARRFAPYKQPSVLISSFDHLKAFLTNFSFPAHLFTAGKAHPTDKVGKIMLQKIYKADHDPTVGDRLVFCENYDLTLAKYLVSGVDVWLNTPKPPWEASGTSGMKALLNGILNASTLDGWWYEAYNGKNGWVIGSMDPTETANFSPKQINDALFYLLEQEITPLFYNRENGVPKMWIAKIKDSLATSAFKFNTKRMVGEYFSKFYLPILKQ